MVAADAAAGRKPSPARAAATLILIFMRTPTLRGIGPALNTACQRVWISQGNCAAPDDASLAQTAEEDRRSMHVDGNVDSARRWLA
jgi:hypothetical protein